MKSKTPAAGAAMGAEEIANKRVILSMGGKGGGGKTCVITGLTEWFDTKEIPVKLDLDTENKARGSLSHFFGELDSNRVQAYS